MQTGAAVSVVSLDGLDVEALSPTPRSEFRESAQKAVDDLVARLREPPASRPRATSAPGR